MKKYILTLLSLLLLPLFAFAAFDSVTLTTDTVISISGINLNVSGSSAEIESITVNASDFTVTLQTGSTFAVSSADRRVIDSASSGTITINRTCTSSEATTSLSGSSGITVTLSIGATCTEATSASTGGGGGGIFAQPAGTPLTGPGISAEPATPAEPSEETATPAVPATPAAPSGAVQPSPVALLVSPVFNRTLKPGMSHVDVKRLQQLLNSDTDTQIASNGVGSSGNETNYFGSLTTKALQKFQAKYGIVSSGTPLTSGYGLVGPKTRAKLAEVFSEGIATPTETSAPVATPSSVAVSAIFTKGLSRGTSNADIKRLQQLLNSDADTQIASAGVGSSGNETEFFGSLTEKAVQKFQVKYDLAGPSSPGYGYVGPKTRSKLQEIFNDVAPGAPQTDSPQTKESTLKAQIDALNAQVSEMLKQLEGLQ